MGQRARDSEGEREQEGPSPSESKIDLARVSKSKRDVESKADWQAHANNQEKGGSEGERERE